MFKKILCFIITMAMLLPLSATAFDPMVSPEGMLPFYDVPKGSWYEESVEFCYVNGLVNGMNATQFSPLSSLTRAQFVMMLANIEGVDTAKYSTNRFKDVKNNSWYYGAVAWGVSAGIVSGVTSDSFAPNSPLTRETMTRMMWLYMKGKGYSISVSANALNSFSDRGKISDWALEGMKYCVSAGLISGMTDTTLSPKSYLNRAQAARILYVFAERYFYGGHTHNYSSPTCTSSATCSICGLKKGLPNGHYIAEYNCERGGFCENCGITVLPTQAHVFSEPTCTEPAICHICGMERGAPLGHTTTCGICQRCGIESFASQYDRVAYHIQKSGIPLEESDSFFLIENYSYTELEYMYAILEYIPATDSFSIIYLHMYESGNYDQTIIKLTKNSSQASFTYEYVYNESPALYGSGNIDKSTFTRESSETLDSYEGTCLDWMLTNMNNGLVNAIAMADVLLSDLCQARVSDLGFTSFAK